MNAEDIISQGSHSLDRLYRQYRKTPNGVVVSFRDLCSSWPWAKRSDIFTHLIHSYPAKILPYIPIYFLTTEQYVSRDGIIMDVFSGSSTVLLESIVHPVYPRDAYGVEINPLARLIAKVKTTAIQPEFITVAFNKVVNLAKKTKQSKIPNYKKLDIWYSQQKQESLGKLAFAIDTTEMTDDVRDFLLVCFSTTSRKCSYSDPDIPVPVRLAIKNNSSIKRRELVTKLLEEIESTDVIHLFSVLVDKNILRLRSFNEVVQITGKKASIVGDDARKLQFSHLGPRGSLNRTNVRPFESDSIDCIITSPPYGAAQKYMRASRLESLWAGLSSQDDITALEKNSIGTEAIAESKLKALISTGYPEIDARLGKIAKKKLAKACLESMYFRDMDQAISEMKRVIKPGGTLILVIGDNKVIGKPMLNHSYLKLMAQSKGLRTDLILKDPVRSRGMMTKRHETAGMISADWVLVFRKE